MDQIRFILCIHNHQPVGNFDHVIEDAYRRAYLPFLEVMEQATDIPWVLHNSGCLWEWLEAHHPEYIERVGSQVAAGRLELLGGGLFEPILPALAPEERRAQLSRMGEYLERRFGARPRGMWLAERVWEPDLPLDLVAAGLRYLPLDDTQLHQVGVAPERVRGAFETESGGAAVRVFPALMSLRYRIPFAPPEETAAFLADPFPGGGPGLAVYADDGEKFGIWPGTHELAYGERWLARFFAALRAQGSRVRATTFAAELEQRAEGLVYLPTGSYAEMGVWALPSEMQAAHALARRHLGEQGLGREADLFLRGGFWRNFFARYPESSWMHLRGTAALARLRAAEAAQSAAQSPAQARALARAREHLMRAQCNCGYWHGVFGGLYLPHLRAGIYGELLRGEEALARAARDAAGWVATREEDLDGDGRPEVVLENESTALFVDPEEGGRLVEWDDRGSAMNLLNVLARRPELYHGKLSEAPSSAPSAQAETIHGAIRAREEGLAGLLVYDEEPRASLIDRFFAERPTAEALRRGLSPLASGSRLPWRSELTRARGELRLRLERELDLPLGAGARLGVSKEIRLRRGERGFRVLWRYRHLAGEAFSVWAAIEQHLNLLAGDAEDRWIEIDGRAPEDRRLRSCGDASGVSRVDLIEQYRGWHVRLEISPAVELARYPVETVSLSETGAERNYQGSALICLLPLNLGPESEISLELSAAVRPGVPAANAETA